MNYNKFISQLDEVRGVAQRDSALCFGHVIEQTSTGIVLIDRYETEFKNLEEARTYLKQQQLTQDIQSQLVESLPENKIAVIIKEHHSDVKVTDKLIETYIEAASSKLFTFDSVVSGIREHTEVKTINKLDFVLEDGTSIAIDRSTFDKLNNMLGQQPEIISYMRESTNNFLTVVDLLEE